MKVSIIIPVFQVEQYIERCINSVLRQTYRELEVILVDDCSPDKSMNIAHDLILNRECKDIEFKFLRHDRNRGLSAARNTGIKTATGSYVYFLDSDDEITEDCISVLVEPIRRFNYDIVTSHYEIKGIKVEYPKQDICGEMMGVKTISKAYSQNRWHCMAWNKLCRRTFLLEKELFFQEGLIHEDELWSALLACNAESMCFVNKSTYNYYLRENSLSTAENYERKISNYIKVLKGFYEYQERRMLVSEGVSDVEMRLKSAITSMMTSNNWSPYKVYATIRQCDSRPSKIINEINNTARKKIINLDVYLPTIIGFLYRKFIDRLLAFQY